MLAARLISARPETARTHSQYRKIPRGRRVVSVSGVRPAMINGMSEYKRRRVGRPATLTYEPAQVNFKVHPNVRRWFQEEAQRRGVSLGTILTEMLAAAEGTTVDELTAPEKSEDGDLIKKSA